MEAMKPTVAQGADWYRCQEDNVSNLG